MPRLIEEFASTLGPSQRRNVEVLVNEGATKGEIADFDSFKSKLEELTGQINLEATPLFKIFELASGRLITSASHNYMLRLIRLDLETIYTEIDNLSNIVGSHRSIMEKRISDTRNALARLDNKVTALEVLANESDYSLSQFNTFNSLGTSALPRTDERAVALYYDFRQGRSVSKFNDASLDIRREGLVLPIIESASAEIVNIEVEAGKDTTESDLDVNPPDNNISNVLVEGDGEYWIHNVLINAFDINDNPVSPPEDGVKARIRVELSGLQDVNLVTLTPLTDSSFTVESITYRGFDGAEYFILSTPSVVNEETTFTFSRVKTDTIWFNLSQDSYSEISNFFYSDLDKLTDTLSAFSKDTGLLDMSITSSSDKKFTKTYSYSIGFDFIGIGRSEYRDLGIYVSEAIPVGSRPTQLRINTSLERSEDSSGNPLDSVEFYIAKYNFNDSNSLISKEIFPVLIDSSVEHESLILSSGVGETVFFPSYSSVKVYRDFTELTLGTDYQLSVDGSNYRDTVSSLDADTVSGPPPEMLIKILDSEVSSVYTVSYTPQTSLDDSSLFLNPSKTVEFTGRVTLFHYLPNENVSRSDVHTIIIIRSLNYSALRETPIIFETDTLVKEEIEDAI